MLPTNKGPKACTTCAKAKARCIPGALDGDKCDRCQRLKKECFSRLPAPPRTKKAPKRSRVAELEKRLNELSSQFEGSGAPAAGSGEQTTTVTQQSETSSPPTTSAPLVPAPTAAPVPASRKSRRGMCAEKGERLSLVHLFPSPRSPGSDSADTSAWSPEVLKDWETPWPLPSEAGVLLIQYHDLWAHLFPFIVIPKHFTAAELRCHRPFLWKAVMMVTCFYDGARHMKLGKELLAEVGKASLIDGSKSLELLQGLQLMIGWFNYALKSTQLTHLLFLARSMCLNLSSTGCDPIPDESKFGELEHLRAYAGTYYLNTLVFTTNKKTDAFMNTSQLESCCRTLETSMEHPSDEYLVKLVKIQQLAQSISLTMAFDPGQPAMLLPLTMVVQSFQEQLDVFRASLPPHLSANSTLQSHLGIAETLLMDIAISDQHCNPSLMPLTDRLQLLWSCVRSLRSFFQIRLTIRDVEQPRFLGLTASDLAYTIITAIKLLMVRLPGWNASQIVNEMGLFEVLEHQIKDLGDLVAIRKRNALSSEEACSSVQDPLDRLHRLLKNARELVEFQLQKREGADLLGDNSGGMGAQSLVGDLDDDLWQDFVNDTAWNINGDLLLMDLS